MRPAREYYEKLYRFQDEILNLFFNIESEFYLTGGTCLHRFYINARYSDDLDFFTPYSDNFGVVIRSFLAELNKKSIKFSRDILNNSFARIKVSKNSLNLVLDFVNDPVKHFGEIKRIKNNIRIDNFQNILSNKLSAVVNRDDPKDVFDIFIIWKSFDVKWSEIIYQLKEKASIEIDYLLYRLKSFPVKWIERLKFVDIKYKNFFYKEYENLITDLENKIIGI